MTQEEKDLLFMWIRANVCYWFYNESIISDYDFDAITEKLKNVYKNQLVKNMFWSDNAFRLTSSRKEYKICRKMIDAVDSRLWTRLMFLKHLGV